MTPEPQIRVSPKIPSTPQTTTFDLDATLTQWDALTPLQLRQRGSRKWTQPKGNVIPAWVAEMDLGTAPAIRASLHHTIENGSLGYLPDKVALHALHDTCAYLRQEFGWSVPLAHISLLPDVLSALTAVITQHTRPGSAVIVPTPAYMPFLSIPVQNGRRCIQIPALRQPQNDMQWELDLDGIAAAMASGAGLLILCNPWNPVGRALTAAELDQVAALSARYGVPVFADEIHAPLIVNPHATHTPYASRPLADPDLTFTATAASKGWNIPGLHCAMLIASAQARAAWQKNPVSARLNTQASVLGAVAASAAFSASRQWNQAARNYIYANGDYLRTALAATAVDVTIPTGTYLAWLNFSKYQLSPSPAQYFAQEPGVIMNDGAAFGRGYENFCRLNLATGRGIIAEIVKRLTNALARA